MDGNAGTNERNQVTPEGECATAVTRNSEEKFIRHVDSIWSCHGLVPVSELIYAAFRHSHDLRLGASRIDPEAGVSIVFSCKCVAVLARRYYALSVICSRLAGHLVAVPIKWVGPLEY